MNGIFDIASKVATPLALAGLFGAILFFTLRRILQAHFISQVHKPDSARILLRIINFLFVLCLVGMILGFAGYVLRLRADNSGGHGFTPSEIPTEQPIIRQAAYDQFFVTLKGNGFGFRKGRITLHYSDGNARVSTEIGDGWVDHWKADEVKFLWPSQLQQRFMTNTQSTYHEIEPLFVLKTATGYSTEWTYFAK